MCGSSSLLTEMCVDKCIHTVGHHVGAAFVPLVRSEDLVMAGRAMRVYDSHL